jgi:hypothetical protein
MKCLALATGLLALGLAASTPARADFAVVQYQNGDCQIWWDSAGDPWGAGWRKIAVALPTWDSAAYALDSARAESVCQ